MTKENYFRLWDSNYVSESPEELKEITPEEMLEDFEEDFRQFLFSDAHAEKLLDIICNQKERMIRQAIESTLILGKIVHVDTYFDETEYKKDFEEYQKEVQEEEDFIRIESAAYNFM